MSLFDCGFFFFSGKCRLIFPLPRRDVALGQKKRVCFRKVNVYFTHLHTHTHTHAENRDILY